MRVEIPFTSFRGPVKQLETDFRLPVMKELFDRCFSAFREVDEMYARFRQEGIEYISNAAGVQLNFGFRPRRFAGGPGLDPGRYFTLCAGDRFDDRGTLRDELTGYYSSRSGMTVTIYDPLLDDYILDHLRASSENFTEDVLAQPFYYFVYQPGRVPEKRFSRRGQTAASEERTGVTYGVREFEARFDRIVDLRDPETQAWFTDTFVGLELENEARVAEETHVTHWPPKEPLASFGELLPVISSLETGGGMAFGQAVGQWLRGHGADGLIFPSARSNAFNSVRNGSSIASGGWNLVVYVGADEPIPKSLFGYMSKWRDGDHDHIRVNYTANGSERGSFKIRGLREFNLAHFDLKKQIACGVREESPMDVMTGTTNWKLSQTVNSVLEQERVDGRLWDDDVDYIGFLAWLEKQWRET